MASRPTHSGAAPALRTRRTIADEAGRGACAGPLVAAACVLPSGRRGRVPGLADSKLLTARRNASMFVTYMPRASRSATGMTTTDQANARSTTSA